MDDPLHLLEEMVLDVLRALQSAPFTLPRKMAAAACASRCRTHIAPTDDGWARQTGRRPGGMLTSWTGAAGARTAFVAAACAAVLRGSESVTLRDVYYSAPAGLFASAGGVAAAAAVLETALGLPRWKLGMTESVSARRAAALEAAGGLRLVPETPGIRACLVVVEKHTVLSGLVAAASSGTFRGVAPFLILLTGSGYPSTGVALMVRLLARAMGAAPRVFLVTDADPHGADIALRYRFGSGSVPVRNPHLVAPAATVWHWLGLHADDPVLDERGCGGEPLTRADTGKLAGLLRSRLLAKLMPAAWRARIESQQALGRKYELEALSADRLASWLAAKLAEAS
ncbi:uncharacterized protein AMSG_06210 [Thecamonas trahens ATCC 50062]|uniref:Topoisomerase 6 subunit A/Spo11 TOPRIM domain-containing protein n=1 Tax=Thecamonas trahens ATCC 50062 TaxID=461836 RepID=A0A0L0DC35_THETB|nr:hypothetical protein AMSG_06210 [Thecamonas trahens ATCC 50062]KNC49909.1 hypothetical protein AMSG_06210 [Thecamonas trahens ATCC 50062]|eukprot:XP_013757390.1 hypothetical protein AMSG_06210 [Thecamonas trahens ATCC 50062]